jgi:hypothetical protein
VQEHVAITRVPRTTEKISKPAAAGNPEHYFPRDLALARRETDEVSPKNLTKYDDGQPGETAYLLFSMDFHM